VGRLLFIHRGYDAGLTLHKVSQILAIHDRGEEPCGYVRQVLHTRLDQVRAQIAELVAQKAMAYPVAIGLLMWMMMRGHRRTSIGPLI
jgi:DNA-binding transcriptional MerR regulator